MADLQFGIIEDNKIYTTKALARIILEREEFSTEAGVRRLRPVDTETINSHLRELRCPVRMVGRTVYVSGLHFRLAIEAKASIDCLAGKRTTGDRTNG